MVLLAMPLWISIPYYIFCIQCSVFIEYLKETVTGGLAQNI